MNETAHTNCCSVIIVRMASKGSKIQGRVGVGGWGVGGKGPLKEPVRRYRTVLYGNRTQDSTRDTRAV